MAAFNNFPTAYQPQQAYQQPMYQYPHYNNQQQQSNMTWVSGEAGAKAYQVAPNTTMALWDSEETRIFLKSSDAMGMPSMKVLDYTVRDESTTQNALMNSQNAPKTDFATKDDILSIQEQINDLRGKLEKERVYERKSNSSGKSITK